MKLVFAGTPEFARVALQALHEAGHEIALVLTQPDRPAGRGMQLQASAVKQYAVQHGLAVCQPHGLGLSGKFAVDAELAREALRAADAQAMVVVAYGLILPQWVLDCMAPGESAGPAGLVKRGSFNIHASLLPRWRGAAPIHRAIEAGDAHTGVTIMQMDAGLDTGDMVLSEALPMDPRDTTASLHDKLANLGARLMLQTLAMAERGGLHPVAQPEQGVCYAHKIEKREAAIDWAHTADQIVRRVRAFNPFPGAHTSLNGELLKIWGAEVSTAVPFSTQKFGEISTVSHDHIGVVAMNSVVNVLQVQRPGGKRMDIAAFLRGKDVRAGMVFEAREAS